MSDIISVNLIAEAQIERLLKPHGGGNCLTDIWLRFC
jgi:hypothetical protein